MQPSPIKLYRIYNHSVMEDIYTSAKFKVLKQENKLQSNTHADTETEIQTWQPLSTALCHVFHTATMEACQMMADTTSASRRVWGVVECRHGSCSVGQCVLGNGWLAPL